jgi:hypothetical protein
VACSARANSDNLAPGKLPDMATTMVKRRRPEWQPACPGVRDHTDGPRTGMGDLTQPHGSFSSRPAGCLGVSTLVSVRSGMS